MGLYDDDDAAVTEGPIDDENYYYVKIWEKWLAVAMKQRMKEDSVKRILEKIVELCDASLAKFATHKELLASKEKATKIIGKIEGYSSSTDHSNATPGWHQEVWRKGWADGLYAQYLQSQNRVNDAKSRAENCAWRVGSWLADEDANKHPTFPKAELEEIVAKSKAITG